MKSVVLFWDNIMNFVLFLLPGFNIQAIQGQRVRATLAGRPECPR